MVNAKNYGEDGEEGTSQSVGNVEKVLNRSLFPSLFDTVSRMQSGVLLSPNGDGQ